MSAWRPRLCWGSCWSCDCRGFGAPSFALDGTPERLGTQRDSKWDTILSWMGHQFAQMGHQFAQMGHEMGHHAAQMGHHFVQMGHERTPTDIKMVSHVVMVKRQANKGLSTRFSGAEWPKNQVTVPKADPTPFCDFRRLWYTPSYKFSAQQGWRHGVRSRSLGGTVYIPVS
jgi:hypothetical protein